MGENRQNGDFDEKRQFRQLSASRLPEIGIPLFSEIPDSPLQASSVLCCTVYSQRPVALPVSVSSSRTSTERPQRLASVVRVEENLTQAERCADVFGLEFGEAYMTWRCSVHHCISCNQPRPATERVTVIIVVKTHLQFVAKHATCKRLTPVVVTSKSDPHRLTIVFPPFQLI